jgi:hypothetical protein
MKRLISLLVLALTVAACGPAETAYKLTFNIPDKARQSELTLTSLKVIERRLDRVGETIKSQQIIPGQNEATIKIGLQSTATAQLLTEELTQPFKLRIMKQVEEGKGQINVEGHGSFAETGMTEADLIWAEAAEDANRKGVVRLLFTPQGTEKLRNIFKENMGKAIGIFVRDRLISKLNVKTDEIEEFIVIRDIPSAEMARIFVDDLNVGLHVTFTPVP